MNFQIAWSETDFSGFWFTCVEGSYQNDVRLYSARLPGVFNLTVITAVVLKGQGSNERSRLPDTASYTVDGRNGAALPKIEHLNQAVCHSRQPGTYGRQHEHAFVTLASHMCFRGVTISIFHIKQRICVPLSLTPIYPWTKKYRNQNACHKYLTGEQTLK